jgi:hypothetical protein
MPRRRITFRQLETFAAVARLGSFTRAAEALHLTQPAVSIQIRQIADTIGLPPLRANWPRNRVDRSRRRIAGHRAYAG